MQKWGEKKKKERHTEAGLQRRKCLDSLWEQKRLLQGMGHCTVLVCLWHEWGDMYDWNGCICMQSAGVSCIMYNMSSGVTIVWRCLSHAVPYGSSITDRPPLDSGSVHFLTLTPLTLCVTDTLSWRNREVLKGLNLCSVGGKTQHFSLLHIWCFFNAN